MIIALQTLVYFRQSFLTALERLLSPYYQVLIGREIEEVEEDEDQVFAEYDDEKGVVFFPPVYAQRYAAVSDCLMDERWAGKLEKVVDLGYHDMSFIKYLKDMPGVRCILGVDIESIPLRCSSELLGTEDYTPKRETPLQVTLFQGNAADPDYRLIGCDAVIAIEMIEHMLPHDLERLVHNVFGFIKPWIAVITTPNADFNVLFKSMEKNGLRRWDHLFEWTREQFHDWCSNIVSRYPQYNVLCKGIGPGPTGTQHLGCCSQMALFVNNNYEKQRDLNIESLALVAKVPSPNNVREMLGGWESPIPITDRPLSPIDNAQSLNEIPYSDQSCVTIVISPSYSIAELEYRDSTSQCNMDSEVGRNYLMFDDEGTDHVLVPRRNTGQRVYIIEDVCSRLNCSTFQVKKFSKPTQNLMARNKLDSLVHTREVVNEIRHLTKMLNFNKCGITDKEHNDHIWCNINWGDGAPYWNQYYKVVREYNYPFETKSDDCRILDLISEEMNRLIDNQYDEEFSADVNKLEIPIAHLMRVVRHITTNVDKVKEQLEWNGYEVVDDVVVHSRLVIDTPSTASDEDWADTDNMSDWDSELRSTSLSDGSTIVPDYHGRFLRKALDKKVRKLRSMMCVDEDITTELDRVVCRLMKLALWTSKGQQKPPPSRWMQCKLLDLLTLTEKAITRRKRFYLEECFPMKALTFVSDNIHNLEKYRSNSPAKRILSRYRELCMSPELSRLVLGGNDMQQDLFESSSNDLITGDDLKMPSNLKRTHSWLQRDRRQSEGPDYTNLDNSFKVSTDQSSCDYDKKAIKRARKSPTQFDSNDDDSDSKAEYKLKGEVISNIVNERRINVNTQESKNANVKISKSDSPKKLTVKKSSSKSINKRKSRKTEDETNHRRNNKIKIKEHQKLQSTATKPIPASIIELCHPDLCTQKNIELVDYNANKTNELENIAATEESLLIDIIMDDKKETIALRRTIGTDAVVSENQMVMERETLLDSALNTLGNDLPCCKANDSQSIFLFDINEPSTSKGVRHTSMDVQCGPDSTPAYVMLSPATSAAKMPSLCDVGHKVGDPYPNHPTVRKSYGTSTNIENFGPVCLRRKSQYFVEKGIKITDSDSDVPKKSGQDCCYTDCDTTGAIEEYEHGTVFIVPKFRKTGIVIRETFSNESTLNENSPKENFQHNFKTDQLKDTEKAKNCKKNSYSDCQESSVVNCGVRNHCESHLTENEGSEDDSSGMLIRHNRSATSAEAKSEAFIFTGDDNADDHNNEIENIDTFDNTCRARSPSPSKRVSFHSKTQMLKVMSSAMELDSGSEYCGRFSPPKSPLYFLSKVINDPLSIEELPEKYVHRRLSCGGVHTHSYRDKHVLEDVMYQGHWQSTCLRTCSRRRIGSAISKGSADKMYIKKKLEKSKETLVVHNIQPKEVEPQQKPKPFKYLRKTGLSSKDQKSEKTEVKRKPVIKYPRFRKAKQEPINVQEEAQQNGSPNVVRNCNYTFKLKKTMSRVTHKSSTSSNKYSKPISATKPSKTLPSTKKTSSTSVTKNTKAVVAKKSTDKIVINKITKKNYIPAYLRRQKLVQKMLNSSFESGRTTVVATSSFNFTPGTINSTEDSAQDIVKKEDMPALEFKTENVRPVEDIAKKDETSKINENKSEVENDTEEHTANKEEFPKINEKKYEFENDTKQHTVNKEEFPKINEKKYESEKDTKQHTAKTDDTSDTNKKKSENENGTKQYTAKTDESSKVNEKNSKGENDTKNINVKQFTIPKYKTVKHVLKNKPRNPLSTLEGKDINKDLLKFSNTLQKVSYAVFRNELENNVKSSTNSNSESPKENSRKKSRKQSSAPTSPNSSCSSPDSVATVKMVTARASRRYSTSSNKSSVVTSESEPTTPAKARKYTKKIKNKKPDEKDCKNKENNPESSKVADKDAVKSDKSVFIGRNKNVFMALATETPTTAKSKSQTATKSNVRIPMVNSVDNKKEKPIKLHVLSANSTKKSAKSTDSLVTQEIHGQTSTSSEISDLVLMIDSRYQGLLQSSRESVTQPTESIKPDDNLSTNDIVRNTVSSTMRCLIEDRLECLNSKSENELTKEDVETPVTSGVSLNNSFFDELDWSYTSVVQESDLNEKDKTPTPTEGDALSFKSITSTSRFSEYFFADNEFENTLLSELPSASAEALQEQAAAAPRSNSVRDIFERKEPLIAPNPANGLAVQAFSGFSMNAEPVSGDQHDYVNMIDSETGSLATDYHARQAASEELFVSGRSSESYESCLIDEDAVVPNWLFEIIQQQQQLAEADSIASSGNPDFLLPLEIPIAEPDLDMNGNMAEPGVGVAAGAGDGRGIHSDHSQDSSGHGTSLSSSETSSAQTSEGVLIESSQFTGQYELLQDSIGSANGVPTLLVPGEMPVVSFRNPDGGGNETVTLGATRDSRRPRRRTAAVSDADADVSSLDTDAADVDSC